MTPNTAQEEFYTLGDDEQPGVGQTDAVPGRGAEKVGELPAGYAQAHRESSKNPSNRALSRAASRVSSPVTGPPVREFKP